MVVADFYKGTKRKPCVVDISRIGDGNRHLISSISVKDKREARAVAVQHGAVCWNF